MKKLFITSILVILIAPLYAQQSIKQRGSEQNPIGDHIISIIPVQAIVTDIFNEDGAVSAFGVSYEHITADPRLSLRVSAAKALTQNRFFIMPGVKFYPKKQGVVKYAIGPQFLIAYGKEQYTKWHNDNNGSSYQEIIDENRVQLGFLINNSVNFTFARYFYMNIEAGLGLKYYDSSKRYQERSYISMLGTGSVSHALQLGMGLGMRF